MNMDNIRRKFAKRPAIIRALERTAARVRRERRAVLAVAAAAAAGAVDVAVQLHAVEQEQREGAVAMAERQPPRGYVWRDGGPELIPAATAAQQRELLARIGNPRQ